MTRTVPRALRLAGIGVVCLVGAVACSTPARPAAKASAPASAPASPAASPSPAAPPGEQVWTFTAVRRAGVAIVSGGYLLAGRRDIYGLGRDGQPRWHHTYTADVDAQVAGSVVLVSRKNPARQEWPGSLIVQALDAASGRVRWSDDQPSFLSVFTTSVYTSVCHGGQHNRIGDCRLSARDPRTGDRRWTIGTYASSQVDGGPYPNPLDGLNAPPVPPYLLVVSYPTGYSSQTVTTVDPGSGRPLGASIRAIGVVAAKDHLVEFDNAANEPARGCRTTVAGWSPRGRTALWRRTLVGTVGADGRCPNVSYRVADRELAVAVGSGRTSLLDLATGKTTWTAPEAGEPVRLGAGYLLTTNTGGGVTYYDRATGTARWRTANAGTSETSQLDWAAGDLDRWLVVAARDSLGSCPGTCPTVGLFDPASGSLYRAPPGQLAAAGSGIVITEIGDDGSASGMSDYRASSIR